MSGRRGRIIVDSRADKRTSNPYAKSNFVQGLCKDFFFADIEEKCIMQGLFLGCKEFLPSEYFSRLVTKTQETYWIVMTNYPLQMEVRFHFWHPSMVNVTKARARFTSDA